MLPVPDPPPWSVRVRLDYGLGVCVARTESATEKGFCEKNQALTRR